MITGFKCDGDTNYKYVVNTEMRKFAENYFKETVKLKKETLESWFLDARVKNDEDIVKVALIYRLTQLFLKNNPTVIPPEFFFVKLVDNLETFSNFPWGKLVCDYFYSTLLWCIYISFK